MTYGRNRSVHSSDNRRNGEEKKQDIPLQSELTRPNSKRQVLVPHTSEPNVLRIVLVPEPKFGRFVETFGDMGNIVDEFRVPQVRY